MPLSSYQKGKLAGMKLANPGLNARKYGGGIRRKMTSAERAGYKQKYSKAKKAKKMPNSRPYVETKFVHVVAPEDPTTLNAGAPDPGQIAGTTVIVPTCWNQGWHQGLTRSDITGRAIYPRYLTMKMSMDTSFLPAGQYNLRCMVGFCTETLQGLEGASLNSAAFVAKVTEQLGLSGMLGSHLDFPIKRKGIKILKDFRVRGNRNASLSAFVPNALDPQSAQAPNPINEFTFKWPMGTKTWTTPDGDSPPVFFPSRAWIPFVAFYSPEFVTMDDASQAPVYLASSKLWYTDQ